MAPAVLMWRVLLGNRLQAVQGGAGFEGLQNLFLQYSFPKSLYAKDLRDRNVTPAGPGPGEMAVFGLKTQVLGRDIEGYSLGGSANK